MISILQNTASRAMAVDVIQWLCMVSIVQNTASKTVAVGGIHIAKYNL
jgi:hypothetical protein